MQKLLRKINKASQQTSDISHILLHIDNMVASFSGNYKTPDYPNDFVKKLLKIANVKESDIERDFFLCFDRAKQYRYCIKVNTQIKYDLIKYALKRLLND